MEAALGTAIINLTGNELVQTLFGNAGDNRLDGKGGADTMTGFNGDDTYFVDNAGDIIVEVSNGGKNDTVVTSVTYALTTKSRVEQLQTSDITSTKAMNLTGNEFAQTIIGNAGANRIDGRAGADTMNGGFGDDTYIVDSASDVVIETAGRGTDKVITSSSFALSATAEVETMQTSGASTTTNINLVGSNTAQSILGNNGSNRIDGKEGADTLRSFGGEDTFVFSTTLISSNIDTIVDFDTVRDRFALEADIFTGLANGKMSAEQFVANTSGVATTADHRIMYETDTGRLFFDADGNGAGGRKQFAVVTPDLALNADDFFVG
jgi:Ca2+-binding RTX toxin-like protein